MLKINGIEIEAEVFAYDGCHKLYVLNDEDAENEAKECGYDIYSIEYLLEAFVNSCPLRFINEWGGDFNTIVRQGEENIIFEGFAIPDDLDSAEYNITVEDDKCTLAVCEMYAIS